MDYPQHIKTCADVEIVVAPCEKEYFQKKNMPKGKKKKAKKRRQFNINEGDLLRLHGELEFINFDEETE